MSLGSAIKCGLTSLGLGSNENFISNLEAYLVLLSRWNRVTNLSGIKRLKEMEADLNVEEKKRLPF